MRYWISWWQPGDDPRPLHFPPKDPRVLGWWRTGQGDEATTICALVEAGSDEQARQAVATDWPESAGTEWRFIERKDGSEWTPGGNRFPLSDWMKQRLNLEI